MNSIQMDKAMEVINLTSLMASPIEVWRDQWTRNGQLQLLSHPKQNQLYLIHKTIRTMRDMERTLRIDLWNKCQRHYPRITIDAFREVFNGLIEQAYSNLRFDLIWFAQDMWK